MEDTTSNGAGYNASQYYILANQPCYSSFLSPSSAASQQSSSITADSAYSSDHTPEEPEEQEEIAELEAATGEESSGLMVIEKEEEKEEGETQQTIAATLVEDKLWESFHKVGNEMIVTKPGRRLFPAVLVTLRGLNPSLTYTIILRIASADPYRYKFLNMQWSSVGESEINQNEFKQLYRHPSSPNSGAFWMKKPISFRAIKITHNPNSKNGNILLHTMHKYVVEVIVRPADNSGDTVLRLDKTSFVAVSAYQNTNLTQLKIDNNPFAKGFRDQRHQGVPHHQRATPYQPLASSSQLQACSFTGNNVQVPSSLQLYGTEGYRPQFLSQQGVQGVQQMQSLPVQPFTPSLRSGCTQLPPLTPSMVGSGCNPLPSLTPSIVGSGCSQFSLPPYNSTMVSGEAAPLTPSLLPPQESYTPESVPNMSAVTPNASSMAQPAASSLPSLSGNFTPTLAQLYSNPGYSFYTQPHPGVSLPTLCSPPSTTPPQ